MIPFPACGRACVRRFSRAPNGTHSHGGLDLLPETPVGTGLISSNVIVRVRPRRPRGSADASRNLDHSEPSTTALRIEVSRNVRTAEGCAALQACRSSKAGGPVAKAGPRAAVAGAAATPATASGLLRMIP